MQPIRYWANSKCWLTAITFLGQEWQSSISFEHKKEEHISPREPLSAFSSALSLRVPHHPGNTTWHDNLFRAWAAGEWGNQGLLQAHHSPLFPTWLLKVDYNNRVNSSFPVAPTSLTSLFEDVGLLTRVLERSCKEELKTCLLWRVTKV